MISFILDFELVISLPSHSPLISIFLLFPFSRFRKYFVLLSPSWYQVVFNLFDRYSPLSDRILSRSRVASSSFSLALYLIESTFVLSNVSCQKINLSLTSLNLLSCFFFSLDAISSAIDLILIFRNSRRWCGSRLTSFNCINLSVKFFRKRSLRIMLSMNLASTRTTLILLHFSVCLFLISTITAA